MSRVLVDSGIKWIGSLPNTWGITTVNKIFYRRKEVNDVEKPTVLSLARDGVKIRDISTNEGQLAESYDNYHKVYKDDLMINPMDLISGANCSLSQVEGVISPAYINLAKKENIYPKYYDYFFKYQYWINAMFIHGKGVSFDNRWTMNWETMSTYKLPFPNYNEQKNIANYLDKQCTKIDEIISDNNHEIELLEEYKNNIILDKVCHGLDYSEFKKINIDSIDKIPVTWGLTRLKYYISIFNGKDCNKNSDSSKIPVYGSGGVFSYTDDYLYDGESLLLGRKGTIDKPIIVNGKFWTVDTMFYSIPKRECNLKYIYYFMKTLNWDKYIFGTALPSMTQSILNEIKIPFLSLDEQNKIVDYLDKQCAKLDCVIDCRKRIIEKLEEYKRSLIYECVTGKREV